jgi:hypothetical protein
MPITIGLKTFATWLCFRGLGEIMKCRSFLALFLSILLAPAVEAQFSDLVYQCGFGFDGGDRTTRGFYAENFPATTLGGVVLVMQSAGASGLHSITLTARADSYDGPVVGASSIDVDLTSTPQQVSFDFSNAVVASGSTVTFEIAVASDPSSLGYAFYDTGDGTACPDITQTNGTSPPLDSFRRNTVGVEIYAVSGNQTIYSVTATVAAGNGNVSCDPASVLPGGSSTCTAVPDTGWQVSGWTGACTVAGTSETCTLENIQADQTSGVNFEAASAVVPVEVTPVPTLSKLGLIILGLLMVFTVAIRYRW